MFGRGDWPRQRGWREVVFVLVVGKMTACRPGIFALNTLEDWNCFVDRARIRSIILARSDRQESASCRVKRTSGYTEAESENEYRVCIISYS